MLTVINPDGTYSGVQYAENKSEYIAHHAQYGQICIWDARPVPAHDGNFKFPTHPDFGTGAFTALIAPRYVSKLDVLRRLKALNLAEQAIALLKADPVLYEEWSAASVLESNNPQVLAVLSQLGADPATILA